MKKGVDQDLEVNCKDGLSSLLNGLLQGPNLLCYQSCYKGSACDPIGFTACTAGGLFSLYGHMCPFEAASGLSKDPVCNPSETYLISWYITISGTLVTRVQL